MFDLKILRTLIDASLAFIGKKIDDSTSKIITSLKKDTDNGTKESIDGQTKMLGQLLSRVENAISKIQEPKFSGEITVDTSSLEEELSMIAEDVKKLQEKEVDTTKIEFLLKQVATQLKNFSFDETNKLLKEISTGLGNVKPLSTIKLDEMQMRAMSNRGGLQVRSDPMPARGVTLTNLALTASNTQYSYVFPSNTVSWTIKLRDQGTLGYYSFTTGKMPSGGDSGNYATIPQNFLQSKDGVEWSGKTIYLGAGSNTQVAEITVYTA
jgi:hypothetical protein